MSLVVLGAGLVIFLAYLFTSIFERTRIPDVLLLTLLGIILGPVTGLVKQEHFGRLGDVATTVALIVILFEGGINLSVRQLRESLDETALVSLSCFLATMLVVALACWGLFGMKPLVAAMAGAIVGGTSSAVVIPIIQKLRLSPMAYAVLFLESAITDVICIVVAMSLLQAYASGAVETGRIIGQIIASLVLASAIGFCGGAVWALLLRKLKGFPVTALATMAYIFVLYGLAEFLGYSGAIAALAFGVTLANIKDVPIERIQKHTRFAVKKPDEMSRYEKTFFEEIVFLLKIFFFLYLGISIKFSRAGTIAAGFGLVVLIFLVRLLVVRFAMPKKVPRYDAMVMSVLVPKGLAAAVLASLPMQKGVEHGDLIQGVAYVVVFLSIAFAAALVTLLERNFKPITAFYEKALGAFPPQINKDSKEAA